MRWRMGTVYGDIILLPVAQCLRMYLHWELEWLVHYAKQIHSQGKTVSWLQTTKFKRRYPFFPKKKQDSTAFLQCACVVRINILPRIWRSAFSTVALFGSSLKKIVMIFQIYFYKKYWYSCGRDFGQIINVNTIVKDTQLQLENMEMVV